MRSKFFKIIFALSVFAFCFVNVNGAESAKLRRTGREPEYDDYRLNRPVLPNTGDIGVIVGFKLAQTGDTIGSFF